MAKRLSLFLFFFAFAAASVAVFARPLPARAAATFYFEAPTSSVPVGATFPVRVLIDSDQPVNAYAIKVSYPANLLELIGTNNARSLITVAPGGPLVTQGGTIEWSGGSARPFTGSGGELLTLAMKTVATGTARLAFYNSVVYLANGKGTKILPAVRSVELLIGPPLKADAVFGKIAQETNADASPPEITFLSFIDNPFNADQKLLGFSVVDPGSGVKENDVRYRSGLFWSAWQAARNPVPLPAGVWQVDFKATDNAGNTALITAYDWREIWPRLVPEAALLLGVAVALYFAVAAILKRKKNRVE